MIGTILAICLAIWFAACAITLWEPSWLSVENYVLLEGIAIMMPFIIVFGGIFVGGLIGVVLAVVSPST